MSDWIEWTGGECPVPAGALVQVRFGDGDLSSAPIYGTAMRWNWMQGGEGGDIVAYRMAAPFDSNPLAIWSSATPPAKDETTSGETLPSRTESRQHVTDAAWVRWNNERADLDRDHWEEMTSRDGVMLVTVEEWDKHTTASQRELGLERCAHDALMERDSLKAENERLRGLLVHTEAELEAQTYAAEYWHEEVERHGLLECQRLNTPLLPQAPAKADTSHALLTVAGCDHRLGGDKAR